jgi:hypothetical protein
VHAEASQEGKRVMGRSVPVGSIRITTTPCQNGSTVNDEIPGSDKPSAQSLQNHQDKKGFMQRRTSRMATFAMLGWTQNERLPFFV